MFPMTCIIDGCDRPVLALAMCNAHYLRHKRGKPMNAPVRLHADDKARFHEKYKVDDETGCWLWTASTDSAGYGAFAVNGVMTQAHRYSHEIHKGVVPLGMHTDHLCRTPGCVNPDHLEAVTPKENCRRSPIHNANKTHCNKGHPLVDGNLYWSKDGKRICRQCRLDRERAKRSAA